MPFTHACGHAPLPGYTIKRGIATGGFGEVYFGITEGGKEVALKRIFRHHDIELRGVRQCLNLKHPHLVHLYDLKKDDRGDYWLVMEYIRGETLHSVLRKHPGGLPHDLIRPWFEQIAAAIHSLHEQGIVHRDIKPANIFIENGLVKVGDYGLCKFIGGSQHRSQTHHVGTIHYMAPEIGKGDYSRTIDIYAAGVLLYEMVTGHVPFDGETTGEILFKHLSESPDLTGTGPFAPIIGRALAKRPGDRFESLAEMSRRVIETNRTVPTSVPPPTFVPPSPAATVSPTMSLPNAAPGATTIVVTSPGSFGSLAGRMSLAVAVCAGLAVAWSELFLGGRWERMMTPFVIAAVASWGVILLSARWSRRAEESMFRRMTLGLMGAALGGLATWLQGYGWIDGLSARTVPSPRTEFFGALYSDNPSIAVLPGFVIYFAVLLMILRWWHLVEEIRPSRFAWPALLTTGFWAYVLLFLLPTGEERLIGFSAVVMMSVAIQLASPRRKLGPVPAKKLRLRWA